MSHQFDKAGFAIAVDGAVHINGTSAPIATLAAFVSRGVTHYFGSELASKVISERKRREEAGNPMSEDEESAYRATLREEFLAKALAGEIGMGHRGPSADPTEAEAERLAWAEVQVVLGQNKIKPEGKGEDRTWHIGADKLTKDELVERRMARHGERLMEEARKALAKKAKDKAKFAERVANEGLDL